MKLWLRAILHGNQGNHRKRRSRITIGETLVKVQTQHFCDSLYEEPTLSWCADVFLFFGVCSNVVIIFEWIGGHTVPWMNYMLTGSPFCTTPLKADVYCNDLCSVDLLSWGQLPRNQLPRGQYPLDELPTSSTPMRTTSHQINWRKLLAKKVVVPQLSTSTQLLSRLKKIVGNHIQTFLRLWMVWRRNRPVQRWRWSSLNQEQCSQLGRYVNGERRSRTLFDRFQNGQYIPADWLNCFSQTSNSLGEWCIHCMCFLVGVGFVGVDLVGGHRSV